VNIMINTDVSGGSKNVESGGGGRRFISSVLIYRKCTQRSIVLLHGKRRLFGKKIEPIGGGAKLAVTASS